jgi:hypothetical protein
MWVWIDRTLAPLDMAVAIAVVFAFGCWISWLRGGFLPSAGQERLNNYTD